MVSDSSKQQGLGEEEQNALKVTRSDNENCSSRQTNQTSSTNTTQATNQRTSSDVEISSCEYRTGTTSQTSLSSEATHYSSSKEEKSPESGRKKYKVRYEIKNSYEGLALDLCFLSSVTLDFVMVTHGVVRGSGH